jgi:hypothetical protein
MTNCKFEFQGILSLNGCLPENRLFVIFAGADIFFGNRSTFLIPGIFYFFGGQKNKSSFL